MEYVIISGALALGVVGGWIIYSARSKRIVNEAQQAATRIVQEAHEIAKLSIREGEARNYEEVEKLRSASEKEQQTLQTENKQFEERLVLEEKRQQQDEEAYQERQSAVDALEKRIEQRKQEARATSENAKGQQRAFERQVQEKAGYSREQVKEQLVDAMVEEVKLHCADRLRNLDEEVEEDVGRHAKRIMGISMQRYTGHFLRERISSSVPLPDGLEKVTASNPRNLDVLQEISGVKFQLSDEKDSFRLETGDGVARELCRRSLARFMSEERIRDPERLVKAIAADLKREISDTGRTAFRTLRLKKAAAEVVELIGRLNFRTSYTQNQFQHSVEAGHLAGLMAAELGLDGEVARRGALLHDIGKALTHEVEGSHDVIGAEIARRNGEEEIVANAIGYHHGEEPLGSPYAPLIAAADALSGGRPGARREMSESYGDRIGDLEKIAASFKGVTQVYAVQAGREIRVHVDDKTVSEEQLTALSEQIAKKISEEMIFPGQIRVTAIREFCAVEYAN
ncbi:MAG: Rnase Y domain-containing protein [Pseudomonadota bacterium]